MTLLRAGRQGTCEHRMRASSVSSSSGHSLAASAGNHRYDPSQTPPLNGRRRRHGLDVGVTGVSGARAPRTRAVCGEAADTASSCQNFFKFFTDAMLCNMVDLGKTVADNMRAERLRRRLTQNDLALRVGWSRQIVWQVEAGARVLKVAELPAVCRALDVSLSELTRGADPDDLAATGL